jgi:predicted nucleotidyltransferase
VSNDVPVEPSGAFSFRPLERGDFALLSQWFLAPHIAPYWKEDAHLAAIEERYGPAIDGIDSSEICIVSIDHTPIGLVQWYRIDDNPNWHEALQSESDLARWLQIPRATVHREIESALRAGILQSRRVGHTKLVSANPQSPYLHALRELMARSFGVPFQLADALKDVPRIHAAFVFGSWAARFNGIEGQRPVGDVDLLVLGEPSESLLYDAVQDAKERLQYEVQVTVRPQDWIERGTGSFHDTVLSRPMVQIDIGGMDDPHIELATSIASVAHS